MPYLLLSGYCGGKEMLDLFYITIGVLFFVMAWYFTRACEKL
jgi:hypothetical protein